MNLRLWDCGSARDGESAMVGLRICTCSAGSVASCLSFRAAGSVGRSAKRRCIFLTQTSAPPAQFKFACAFSCRAAVSCRSVACTKASGAVIGSYRLVGSLTDRLVGW